MNIQSLLFKNGSLTQVIFLLIFFKVSNRRTKAFTISISHIPYPFFALLAYFSLRNGLFKHMKSNLRGVVIVLNGKLFI